MKYIMFEESAVQTLATSVECQSTDYLIGQKFIEIVQGQTDDISLLNNVVILKDSDKGLLFVGKEKSAKILVIDLTTCNLLKIEENHPENILVVLQKTFRATLRFWNKQPFTNAERVNNSKLVVFPFPYNFNAKASNKRIVLERETKSRRLTVRGIDSPILAYKYNDESVPYGSSETVGLKILECAGEYYISIKNCIEFEENNERSEKESESRIFEEIATTNDVDNSSFKFMSYDSQYSKLTLKQKRVVDFQDNTVPLRIMGAAGTGKTTSMLLRAYRLLKDAQKSKTPFNSIFFAHSESTKYELEQSFKMLDTSNEFCDSTGEQRIEFITLFAFCKRFRGIKDVQVLDQDASDAKEYQLMLIEDSIEHVKKEKYKSFRPYLSEALKELFDSTENYVLASMMQHEFSIQIKGRADGNFESYSNLVSLQNGLPVMDYNCLNAEGKRYKDKDIVYEIYNEYQNKLEGMASYDVDDIVIEALLGLNAPIWRRERHMYGYDYIFVDEIHLFNLNEQNTFHYLTKDIDQKRIPICFALDYSQAIGDRGNLSDGYIEKELSHDENVECTTVFRSSPQITNLCASIIASGALIFQSAFRNPYSAVPQNNSVFANETSEYLMPELVMYENEQAMVEAIDGLCKKITKNIQCKRNKIAIITFDDDYLNDVTKRDALVNSIESTVSILNGRNASVLGSLPQDSVVLTSPYNVNGLEFDAVILLGVDGKRVPPTEGVADIAKNYLRYKTYNMLYLSVSRAKSKVYMVGNRQNGESECLCHSKKSGTIKEIKG